MSRREDFARRLDGDTAAGGSSTAGLADIATALRAMGRSVTLPAPDPQFRIDLRQRLVAVATVQHAGPAIAGAGAAVPSRVAGRRTPRASDRAVPRGRRTLLAMAAGVAVVTSVAGVSVAASRSLPGSPFYDVKRAAESVQLFTARGQLDKGHRHLEFAATRLSEARALSPTSSHLPSTLDGMDSQTRDGSSDLIAAALSSHSVAPLTELRTFAHSQYAGLKSLIATSPPALRQREAQSANLLAGIDGEAAQLAVATTGSGPVLGPGSGLGGLLQGALPGGVGSGGAASGGTAPGQPGPGTVTVPGGQGSASPAPVVTPSVGGVPTPKPSLPIQLPTKLPLPLPTKLPVLPLPSTLPALPPLLPSTPPTVLPPLPTTLPTLLPSLLPTIKL
jgi:hypothetical protein